jgi:hypothetical protein
LPDSRNSDDNRAVSYESSSFDSGPDLGDAFVRREVQRSDKTGHYHALRRQGPSFSKAADMSDDTCVANGVNSASTEVASDSRARKNSNTVPSAMDHIVESLPMMWYKLMGICQFTGEHPCVVMKAHVCSLVEMFLAQDQAEHNELIIDEQIERSRTTLNRSVDNLAGVSTDSCIYCVQVVDANHYIMEECIVKGSMGQLAEG